MRELIIYCWSDDLVELRGIVEDEFDTSDGCWGADVAALDGTCLFVWAHWCGEVNPDGWSLGVVAGSGKTSWAIRFGRAIEFDQDSDPEVPALIITVPEGTVVKEVRDDA